MTNGWIRCDERMPEEFGHVIASGVSIFFGREYDVICEAYWYKATFGNRKWYSCQGRRLYAVRFWQPLPEPPEEN